MRYSLFSEKGIREINQDAVFGAVSGSKGLFALADGMGGHAEGEYASRHIIAAIKEWWDVLQKYSDTTHEKALEQCNDVITRVNTEIYKYYKEKNETGGSTVVILLILGNEAGIVSVGDSRIYEVKGSKLFQITVDDVWENLPENKLLSQEEIDSDSRKGKLVSSVGAFEEVKSRMESFKVNKGDRFLLCSDGVYKYCKEVTIGKILGNRLFGVEKNVSRLQKTVENNETHDNYSAVYCVV